MKPEQEIRSYLDDLRWALRQPCNCAATGHVAECQEGHLLIQGTINTLEWVLCTHPVTERAVEHFAAQRRRSGQSHS